MVFKLANAHVRRFADIWVPSRPPLQKLSCFRVPVHMGPLQMFGSPSQGWGTDNIHTLHLKGSWHLLCACVLNCPQVSTLLVWERVCFCMDNMGSWVV